MQLKIFHNPRMNIAKATFLCFATPFYNSVTNQTPQKMGAPMAPPVSLIKLTLFTARCFCLRLDPRQGRAHPPRVPLPLRVIVGKRPSARRDGKSVLNCSPMCRRRCCTSCMCRCARGCSCHIPRRPRPHSLASWPLRARQSQRRLW